MSTFAGSNENPCADRVLLRSRNKSRFAVGFWEYFGAAVFSTLFEKHSPRASGACGSHVERTLIRAFRRATLVYNGYRPSIVHPHWINQCETPVLASDHRCGG